MLVSYRCHDMHNYCICTSYLYIRWPLWVSMGSGQVGTRAAERNRYWGLTAWNSLPGSISVLTSSRRAATCRIRSTGRPPAGVGRPCSAWSPTGDGPSLDHEYVVYIPMSLAGVPGLVGKATEYFQGSFS